MSTYEIRVQGRLDPHWAAWFEGLTLIYEGDGTVLRGPLADEAALHGVLTKVGNLNLHLLSVYTIETSDATPGTGMSASADQQAATSDVPRGEDDSPAPARANKAGKSRPRRRKGAS